MLHPRVVGDVQCQALARVGDAPTGEDDIVLGEGGDVAVVRGGHDAPWEPGDHACGWDNLTVREEV